MLRLLWDYVTTSSLLLGGGAGVGVAVASFYLELSEAADQVPRVKKTAPSTCGYLDPFSGTPVFFWSSFHQSLLYEGGQVWDSGALSCLPGGQLCLPLLSWSIC